MGNTEYTSVEIDDRKLTIYYDNHPESPREWDNLGTIAAFHRNYDLGEIQTIPRLFCELDHSKWSEEKYSDLLYSEDLDAILKEMDKQGFIYLPVYMYEHSGITIATSPFSCRWDSGLLGIIFVSRETILKEFGWKRITKERRERIVNRLESEIKTYDQYLTGEVFGFQVTKAGEEVDSCWGFYHLKDIGEYLSESDLDLFEKLKKQEHL